MVRRCEDLDTRCSFFFYTSQLIKRNENKHLYKTFGQLLYRASIDRQGKTSCHQEENVLVLTNVPDLSKINRI
jgi:hypothetical protein